jgi:transposase
MSGKRYPEEFKIEAVKQVVDRGHSIANVAKRLDITTHSLYAWVKKYGPDSKKHNDLTDAQAEIKRLQKELKRTTEERDILKKAAVDSSYHRNTLVNHVRWRLKFQRLSWAFI